MKKRRRESAQRSRQRKSAYMRALEMENRALKQENERLRWVLGCRAAGILPMLQRERVCGKDAPARV